MSNRATGVGSMPGLDLAEATRVVLGELADLPHLVELPARGPEASMVGRGVAMCDGLAFDLQPAGWRLTGAPGVDQRRASSLLAQDLDRTEELTADRPGGFKLQVTGPWTLAATVERPRGDKALADHGARRDLAQALAEGVGDHVAAVRRRLGAEPLVLQLDEPALPAVLGGGVPTSSGFHRHRSVGAPEASQALTWVAEAARRAGASVVLHCCADALPFDVLRAVPLDAVSFDLGLVGPAQYDDLGRWVESGRAAWLGVVPGTEPAGPAPTATELTGRVLSWWRDLGFTDLEAMPDTVVTPVCGLAGATPTWARTALGLCALVVRNLSVEQGRMDP